MERSLREEEEEGGAQRGHRPHQQRACELFHIYALAAGHATMSCAIYNSPCLE